MTSTADLSFDHAFDPNVYGNGDPATFGLPLDLYERMRADAPCAKLTFDDPLMVDEVWCVSRHADIAALYKDYKRLLSGLNLPTIIKFSPVDPVHKPGLLVQDGKKHRENRQLIGKAFRTATIRRLEGEFRSAAIGFIEAAIEKETFDFITEIAHPLPMKAIGDVLGVPEEDRPQFFSWVDSFVSPYDERCAPQLQHAIESLNALWEYALEITERKRKDPADDVLSILATSNMPDNEIQGHVALFALGATDTTRTVFGHGLHELMRNEEQMAWLRERADDVPDSAVEELIRIGSPGLAVLLTANEDIELHGELIKAGDLVAPLLPSGSFDPDAIPDPRRFDLSREHNEHLNFGGGPHRCMGQHVAAFEIKILLEELLKRTSDIRPAGPISYVKSNLSRGVYSLPVTVAPA